MFLKFEPTAENMKKLVDLLPDCSVRPSKEVLEGLLQHPLARIGYVWARCFGRSGLSPFAYAGITGVPPQEVMKQLEKEGTFSSLSMCCTVQLPIASLRYGIQSDFWEVFSPPDHHYGKFYNEYDDNILEQEYGEKENKGNWSYEPEERAPHSAPWSKRYMKDLMKRYGGKNWRKHCRRLFDPFRAREVQHVEPITLKQWRKMKQVYFLNKAGRPQVQR